MNREEAVSLIRQYTTNENLIKHMFAVETAMRAYADKYGQDLQEWGLCGLLHDFDYEKMGSEHPSEWGYSILRKNGVSEDIIQAIEGHAHRDDPSTRPTLMSKALFAVDELTGLIVACALPRPNQISDLELKSVKKKFKDKAFAKGVNREDVTVGAKELGVELDEHIQFVLDALRADKNVLGLK